MAGCDGCGRHEKRYDDEEDEEDGVLIESCMDCGWRLCGSCASSEGRAPCRCMNSEMGVAYCDFDGLKPWMGSSGGARYSGPFKCRAQREMEYELMNDRIGGGRCLTACCFSECRKPLSAAESKLCTRCRSVVYCSLDCQRAAWTATNGTRGPHKEACSNYLSPECWPYISREFRAYYEHWQRYPTAKPTIAQRADEDDQSVLMNPGQDRAQPADLDEEYRHAYLRARDAMLVEAGLGEFASESPPPQSPGSPSRINEDLRRYREQAAIQTVERVGASIPNPEQTGPMLVNDGIWDASGEDEGDIPMMDRATASSRALHILDNLRRDFGREASSTGYGS
mmetsp:Transcript_20795/g.53055  ORF Transcript_20795/g.53055 Transcript_20795/m.53055 type:complete len:339 (+) Transcript_20795:1-1017(+)